MKRSLFAAFLGIVLLLGFTGCEKDDPVTTPSPNLEFSLKVDNNAMAKAIADSISYDTIKVLIRDLKLKKSGGNDTSNARTGMFAVMLKLDGSITQIALSLLPAGTYERAKFYIHKPNDNETPPDPEFKTGTATNERFSVIVKGKYNGVPFVYKSKKSATEEIEFDSVVTIGSTGSTNITLIVNPSTWFKKGTEILNPSDPANENDIDNNIKDSFLKAFRDNNKDGKPDN